MSVRDLFHPPIVLRIKTSAARFPLSFPKYGKSLVRLTYQNGGKASDVKENIDRFPETSLIEE